MNNSDRVIIIHNGLAWFPKVTCNSKGFTLQEAQKVISDNCCTDAYIVSIKDEISKYGLKGDSIHKSLMDSECYEFDTWNRAYMNRNINITNLPIHVPTNVDYENRLAVELKKYIDELNRPPFVYDIDLIESINSYCSLITEAFTFLKDKKDEEAEKRLKEILQSYLNYPFIVNTLDNSYSFRGIAPFEGFHSSSNSSVYGKMMSEQLTFFRVRTKNKDDKDTRIEELGDIVHLPYEKLEYASQMRFSKAKSPCLYLGLTSYVCAKECRWDDKVDYLYGSVFVPTDEGLQLKILNLTLSQYLIDGIHHSFSSDDSDERRELQREILKLYPLVLAISFSIDEQNRDIKHEYLISQCLMKVLHEVGIDGVAYLSAQGEDEFQYPHGVNLALPAYDISATRQYSKYCSMFEITKPVRFDHQNGVGMRSYINKIYMKNYDNHSFENFTSKISVNGKMVFYGSTKYSKFDDYLCSLERHKMHRL